ncbi:MAG: hypothetical protein LBF65_01715 [Holosporales bacterium]|nr:hypothetical protein [Holosporales bacterium]
MNKLYPVIERIEDRRHVTQAQSCNGLNVHMAAQSKQRIDEPANLRGFCINTSVFIELHEHGRSEST